MPGHSISITAYIVALLLLCTEASLQIQQWPDQPQPNVTTFRSAIIQFDANTLKFDAVSGTLVLPALCPQCDLTDKIIGIKYRKRVSPYLEEVLNFYKAHFNPRAVVIFGGSLSICPPSMTPLTCTGYRGDGDH